LGTLAFGKSPCCLFTEWLSRQRTSNFTRAMKINKPHPAPSSSARPAHPAHFFSKSGLDGGWTGAG